jgi:hypothetical protein
MNDEQRRTGAFWAQPFGAWPFSRQAVLRLAYVVILHRARRAWPGAKMAFAAALG